MRRHAPNHVVRFLARRVGLTSSTATARTTTSTASVRRARPSPFAQGLPSSLLCGPTQQQQQQPRRDHFLPSGAFASVTVRSLTTEDAIAVVGGFAVGLPVLYLFNTWNKQRQVRNAPSQHVPKRPSEQSRLAATSAGGSAAASARAADDPQAQPDAHGAEAGSAAAAAYTHTQEYLRFVMDADAVVKALIAAGSGSSSSSSSSSISSSNNSSTTNTTTTADDSSDAGAGSRAVAPDAVTREGLLFDALTLWSIGADNAVVQAGKVSVGIRVLCACAASCTRASLSSSYFC
jgi:hypothetical protein